MYNLRTCVWEITLGCCFSCEYCGSGGGKARENELTTKECFKVADELGELGCRRVNLIGGEVFMRPDWKDIVCRLQGRGMDVCIISNGYMIDKDMAILLKGLGIESLALSLDGPETVHDRYRQTGSYKMVKRALGVLANAGVPTSVITTINAENVECLEELYVFLKDYPVFAWQLQACIPMGNAHMRHVDHRFDPLRVIKFVEDYAPSAPFLLGIADNIGYFTEKEGSLRGNLSGQAFYPGCQAGISVIGIDSIGNVKGCESLYDEKFFEGNLRDRNLKDIWENPEAFAYNRKFKAEDLKGQCAECTEKSRCRGGCRSYAYFAGEDMYAFPACARNTEEMKKCGAGKK